MGQAWHRQDIIAAVRKRGTSLAQLATDHGYDRGTLTRSLYSKRYPKAHAIIAAFLGQSRHELWPHWYGPADELLPLAKERKAA